MYARFVICWIFTFFLYLIPTCGGVFVCGISLKGVEKYCFECIILTFLTF